MLLRRGILASSILAGLIIVLTVSPLSAKPGTVKTSQGTVFKGDVTEDDTYVYITTAPDVKVKLDKRNATIEYEQTLDDQYDARHAKLGDKDVKGRIDLAKWANDNKRADLAVKALQEARKIDPFNKDAATALDLANRQVELDKEAANAKPAVPATEPSKGNTPGIAPGATNPVAPPVAPLERRLLTADEINIIRQKEMKADDSKVKVKFDNNVIKRFLSTGDRDAAVFNKLSPEGQAIEILSNGDPSMANDVRITTDPAPLAEFKTKIYPLIANGCGSTSCHGGMKGGDLAFFPGESAAALYTNFFILQTYATTVEGVKYSLMDRDTPKHSLVLQFGLPASIGKPSHPKSLNFKPRFKSELDPAFKQIDDWLSNSLQLPQPDYAFKVGVKLPGAEAPGGAPAPPPVPPK